MNKANLFTTLIFYLGTLIIFLATPFAIYSYCNYPKAISSSCEPASNYDCGEDAIIEILNIRADQIEEYEEHCENTYDNACTEIALVPGVSGYSLFCYPQKDQPTPTPPPPECGYLSQSCCLDMEGKNYCLPGQGGPKVTGGTGCVCTKEEPTVAATPYPTISQKDPKINCKTKDDKDGVQTALGCVPTEPMDLVKQLFPYLLGFGGLAAFGLIVYSGFQLMTSSGDPQKIQGAKETITSAVTGLIFIILSLFLLRLIGVDILGLPGLE